MSVLADNRRTERRHSQSCVRSILLPGMESVLLFLLSSGGIDLDSGENAAGVEHDVLGWGADGVVARAAGGSEST